MNKNLDNNLKSIILDLSKYYSISAKFQLEDFTEILNDKIKYWQYHLKKNKKAEQKPTISKKTP
jgi:hypothetical protein